MPAIDNNTVNLVKPIHRAECRLRRIAAA